MTGHGGKLPLEPEYMDNDLEERLLSLRNMVDLALLALQSDRHELIPTAIEEAHYKTQALIDEYCISE